VFFDHTSCARQSRGDHDLALVRSQGAIFAVIDPEDVDKMVVVFAFRTGAQRDAVMLQTAGELCSGKKELVAQRRHAVESLQTATRWVRCVGLVGTRVVFGDTSGGRCARDEAATPRAEIHDDLEIASCRNEEDELLTTASPRPRHVARAASSRHCSGGRLQVVRPLLTAGDHAVRDRLAALPAHDARGS